MTELIEAVRRAQVYDVSPTLDSDTPVFPGHPEPRFEAARTHANDGYFVQTISLGEHTGSHVDAPAHALRSQPDATIDTYAARRFIAPYALFDLAPLRLGAGELASAEDLHAAADRDRLALHPGDAALLCFGWDQHRARGAWWAANTPGLDASACGWLLEEQVGLVGSDTPTADAAVVGGEIVAQHGHVEYFLPNDILLVEGLIGLGDVPRTGVIVAAPLKIAGGSGAPARVLLLTRPGRMTAPAPAGVAASFGFGDRLGFATPGHIAAMRATRSAVVPFFAQQSARELRRTGRSWSEVVGAASAAVAAEGWDGPHGADADHCKDVADVAAARECGYTMFTLDPSDHIGASSVPENDVEEAVQSRAGEHPEEEVRATARRWLPVVEHVATLAAKVPAGADLEVSIDETSEPTTPFEHAFVASELRRRDVPLTSLAPRFPGAFEKGIDYRGSIETFVGAVRAHAHIARAYGPYKLSLHSGSDKLRLYRPLARETEGLFHVKTAGTSYLEALRVAAHAEPALLREIWATAIAQFANDRTSYATTAEIAKVPAGLAERMPAALLDDPHARRILHVTFGSALSSDALAARLRSVLSSDGGVAYSAALERHFHAHLEALGI